MDANITTTAGETFSMDDHARMAWLIFVRFGRNIEAGAAAWRRMLQNSATEEDFEELVNAGALLAVEGERQAHAAYGKELDRVVGAVEHELEWAREMADYEPLDSQERDRKRRLDGIVTGLETALKAVKGE